MAKECAFCPATAKITGEHVWSDWMNNTLPPSSGYTFQQIANDGSVTKEFPAKDLNLTTKVVCKACNEGWMSEMENRFAKPAMVDLILGNRIGEISKKRALGLSLFAFKTAVITNRSLPESEFFFDKVDRYRFRESFTIPRGVTMFIVCMEQLVFSGGFRSHNIFFRNERPHLTLNVCSFRIGRLGFQVVCGKPITVMNVESLPTPPGLTTEFYPTLHPQIQWPRKKLLGVESFDDFCSRWDSIRRR
jgi:hypothetical protein